MAAAENTYSLDDPRGIDISENLPVIFDLGLIDYKRALRYQKDMFLEAKNGTFKSALIICRHFPVITLGRRAYNGNILVGQEELRERDIQVFGIERGGDVTYHGPGQIVVYPIVNLNFLKKDVHWFLRRLENMIIDLLLDFGVCAARKEGYTGVWVNDKKIASIGISIKNWITFHGLSLNVLESDLVNFRMIRPCGMDIEMTCLETVLGRRIEPDNLKEKLIYRFSGFWASQYKGGNQHD